MGCQPRCNNVPALLDDPTPNEQALWSYVASINQSKCGKDGECIPLPILVQPTECEENFRRWLELNRNHCGQNTFCQYVPPLLDELCPSNLKVLEFSVPPVPDDDTGGGQGGQGGGGNECDPLKGGGIVITCLDPNSLGPGATDCSIDCSAILPEIRFRASGGEPPYVWSLAGVPADCLSGFGGVGGPGFGGPTTDSLCDSRFVVTAPTKSVVGGSAYDRLSQYCRDVGFVTLCAFFQNRRVTATFGCQDQFISCGDQVGGQAGRPCCTGAAGGFPCTAQVPPSLGTCSSGFCFGVQGWAAGSPSPCTVDPALDICPHIVVDVRSAAQIAAGCVPCKLCFDGLVVTATDSLGAAASIIVTVDP